MAQAPVWHRGFAWVRSLGSREINSRRNLQWVRLGPYAKRAEFPLLLCGCRKQTVRFRLFPDLDADLTQGGRELKVRVEGRLVFNNTNMAIEAAMAGFGLAYLLEDRVQDSLQEGRLVQVLADWCPPFAGYYTYYPSRRQPAPAFALLVDTLRCRG